MSICKKDLSDSILRMEVVDTYQESSKTMQQIAAELGVGHHTVCAILKEELLPEEFARLKAERYSESKLGHKNPMCGKVPSNFRGTCEDGRGYLTRVVRGKRYFDHRVVMAETKLGVPVEHLSSQLVVHHIDGIRKTTVPRIWPFAPKQSTRGFTGDRRGGGPFAVRSPLCGFGKKTPANLLPPNV